MNVGILHICEGYRRFYCITHAVLFIRRQREFYCLGDLGMP